MSIKGSPHRWLDAALDRGDGVAAWTVAYEFPRGRLSVDYALAVLILGTDDADRFDRGAARLLDRWVREVRGATSAERDALAAIIDGLPDLAAVVDLANFCEARGGLTRTASTLEHLYPSVQRLVGLAASEQLEDHVGVGGDRQPEGEEGARESCAAPGGCSAGIVAGAVWSYCRRAVDRDLFDVNPHGANPSCGRRPR